MRQVGYKANTAKKPQNLTESKGYQEELAKYGLTEEFITTELVSDIKAKPRKRFFELNLGAEILGMKKRAEQPMNQIPHVTLIQIKMPDGTTQSHNILPQP